MLTCHAEPLELIASSPSPPYLYDCCAASGALSADATLMPRYAVEVIASAFRMYAQRYAENAIARRQMLHIIAAVITPALHTLRCQIRHPLDAAR